MDPCLQGLASRLQKSVLSARAPSTTSTYHREFKRWKDFAVSNLKGNYLPANPIHVAVYLQHVLESTKSCSSTTFLHDFQSRSLWSFSSFSLLIKPYTFSSRL